MRYGRLWLLGLIFAVVLATAQQPIAPVAQATRQALLDNQYVSVVRLDVPRGAVAEIGSATRDSIVVAPGYAELIDLETHAPAWDAEADRVEFVKRGPMRRVINAGSAPVRAVVVELKQHWNAEVHRCTPPKDCARVIKAGGEPVGESRMLFTNGFVTAQAHRLDAGGSLRSSYYSSRGVNYILVIPLTDMNAAFAGVEQALKAEQVYFSDAQELEVSATSQPAKWVVIRFNLPR